MLLIIQLLVDEDKKTDPLTQLQIVFIIIDYY